MINSRHIRHLASVLLRILPSCILVIAVTFMLTSQSAEAASTCGYVANHAEPLLNPDVVFLLFVVALMGLFLEISHPGTILPGVVGAISLLLFFFAASSMALNWTGLALMLLSFVLLILDVKLPAHGVLTLGAVVSLVAGTFIFFSPGGQQIDPWLVYTIGAAVGVIGLVLMTFVIRARRRPVLNGVEGMIGARVVAITPLAPEGRVNYFGENWAAILNIPGLSVRAGTELQIVSVQGLCLCVRPLHTDTRPVSNID